MRILHFELSMENGTIQRKRASSVDLREEFFNSILTSKGIRTGGDI